MFGVARCRVVVNGRIGRWGWRCGSVNVLCRLFVYLCFEDQWHRAKLLDHRDRRTDGKTGDDCRKHD